MRIVSPGTALFTAFHIPSTISTIIVFPEGGGSLGQAPKESGETSAVNKVAITSEVKITMEDDFLFSMSVIVNLRVSQVITFILQITLVQKRFLVNEF